MDAGFVSRNAGLRSYGKTAVPAPAVIIAQVSPAGIWRVTCIT